VSSQAYDNGYRRGMFDKCNGIDEKSFDELELSMYNVQYVTGYHDGYDSNERKI
jgi:hypothetical protein